MMKRRKRGQVSVEFLVIVGFVLFLIMGIMSVGYYYLNNMRDSIVFSEVNILANNIISSAEKVFYEGEPSKATINIRIPDSVRSITIVDNSLIFEVESSNGVARIAYSGNVDIAGTIDASISSGKLELTADSNKVDIRQI